MLYRIRPDPTRFMDNLHHRHRITGSDHRLLRIFSSQPESESNPQFELHEDDIFSTQISPIPDSPNPNPQNPRNSGFRRRISDRSFGILAVLPDRNPSPNHNLMPKLSISFSSSSMTIPPSARARAEEKEKVLRSSAPVTIPAVNGERSFDFGLDDADDDEMATMMIVPPHEMVARRRSPLSVLEGVGRTLKGRDLRRMRNAILID